MTERNRSRLAPTRLDPPTFWQSYLKHIRNHEGVVERIYSDPKGIPTMGVGTALAVKGKDGKLVLRDRDELDRLIGTAAGREVTLTDEEYARLEAATTAANRGDRAAAEELIPPHKGDKGDADNNRFGFALSKDGIDELARQDGERARRAVLRDIDKAAAAKGWPPEEIKAFKREFEHSREMIGLAALKQNMGENKPLPNTIDAVLDGDRVRAAYEIAYRSNADKMEGHADRRLDEAGFVLPDADALTPAEREAGAAFLGTVRGDIEAYERRFSHAFDGGRSLLGRVVSVKEAMVKAPHELSAPEVRAMMFADAFWIASHPHHRALHEKVRDFYGRHCPNESRRGEFGG